MFAGASLNPREPQRIQDWGGWGQGRSDLCSHSALGLIILSSPSHQWCAPHTHTPSLVPEAPGILNKEGVLMSHGTPEQASGDPEAGMEASETPMSQAPSLPWLEFQDLPHRWLSYLPPQGVINRSRRHVNGMSIKSNNWFN